MKLLVTGASGFIGSNIAKTLVEYKHEVFAIGSRSENMVPGVKLFISTHLQGIDWDRIPSVDAVFHLAANNDTLCQDEKEIRRSNVEDAKILMEKMYNKGCKRFIYASSTAVYGNEPAPYREDETRFNPLNLYGKSKVAMELAGNSFASKRPDAIFIPMRYCNVYGPGEGHKGHRMSMIGQLLRKMMAGKQPKLFRDGEQKRDWIHVHDVVRANILALNHPVSEAFNCGYGQAVTFNQLVGWINDAVGNVRKISPEYIDNPYEDKYQTFTECGMWKANNLLGFTAQISPEEGIHQYHRHLSAQ